MLCPCVNKTKSYRIRKPVGIPKYADLMHRERCRNFRSNVVQTKRDSHSTRPSSLDAGNCSRAAPYIGHRGNLLGKPSLPISFTSLYNISLHSTLRVYYGNEYVEGGVWGEVQRDKSTEDGILRRTVLPFSRCGRTSAPGSPRLRPPLISAGRSVTEPGRQLWFIVVHCGSFRQHPLFFACLLIWLPWTRRRV